MTIVVNVSDVRTSADIRDIIVTHSLGSCVGVCLYDPVANVAGMLHYQLPEAPKEPGRPVQRPAMYADTGLQLLIEQMLALGAVKRRMKVVLAGGASMFNDDSTFQIGKRNQASIRKLLFQQGMFIESQDLGGNSPRTVYLNVGNGQVTIKSGGASNAA